MNLKELIKELCKKRNITMSSVEDELGFARGYLSKLDKSIPNTVKMQKIADYFGVTIEYLMTGKEPESVESKLTAKDEKDIAKDLELIKNKLLSKEAGPASFDGKNLSDETSELLLVEIESMLKKIKIMNKETYNPNKNKSRWVHLSKSIKQIVNYYINKTGSTDPFRIAKDMNILISYSDLGEYDGCYMLLKRRRCIFLNNNLNEIELKTVMAHELGHAILHRTQNCYFIRNRTYLSCSIIEREANTFAADLIISDEELRDYSYMTTYQLANMYGLDEEIIKLRIKQ